MSKQQSRKAQTSTTEWPQSSAVFLFDYGSDVFMQTASDIGKLHENRETYEESSVVGELFKAKKLALKFSF